MLHFDYTTTWNGKQVYFILLLQFIVSTACFMLLLSQCGSIALWIYCEWNQQTVFIDLMFYSFFITVREQKERKAISVEEKLDIPAQIHVNRLTYVALAATFRIVHWHWTLLLKQEKTGECYALCGRFSGKKGSLSHS